MKLQSYACGHWLNGNTDGVEVFNAINGDSVGFVSIDGINFE